MARPRISVLLPYRDVAETIEEAVETTLDQVGVDVELVAIDDGSRDDGPARVAKIAALHNRSSSSSIVLLSTGPPGASIGIVGALNRGLEAATSDLIARMDGDDVCASERLAKSFDVLARDPGLGAVGTQVRAFPDEAVGEGLRLYVEWQNALVSPADHARELLIESPLCHPAVLLRREALVRLDGWRTFVGPEDYDLWLRLDEAGFGLAKVPEVLLGWRHRMGRMTFSHPHCTPDRIREVKVPHAARRVRARGKPLWMWGAGPNGKRLARALEAHDLFAERFIDVDVNKIGRTARGARIVSPDDLPSPDTCTILVAVASRGARDLIRPVLAAAGFREGVEAFFVA